MKRPPLSVVNKFTILLGIFLIIEGFWGLFSPVVFGVLSTNPLHAGVHLVLGFTGLYLALRNHARKFTIYVGVLLLAVGILYFLPVTDKIVIRVFNVNTFVAYLNVFVGLAAILFAIATPKRLVGRHNA